MCHGEMEEWYCEPHFKQIEKQRRRLKRVITLNDWLTPLWIGTVTGMFTAVSTHHYPHLADDIFLLLMSASGLLVTYINFYVSREA